MGRAIAPFIAFLLLGLGLLAAPASAADGPACSPFSLAQRYAGWGPAAAFGRPVDVVYRGTSCSSRDADAVNVEIDGKAWISAVNGRTIATRSFSVDGSWTGGTGAGWSPPWWRCDVQAADYDWEIPGVYSFRMAAAAGVWTLDVSPGASGPFHWSYSAC